MNKYFQKNARAAKNGRCYHFTPFRIFYKLFSLNDSEVRDTILQRQKTGKCGNFYQVGDISQPRSQSGGMYYPPPPLPPFGNFVPSLPIFLSFCGSLVSLTLSILMELLGVFTDTSPGKDWWTENNLIHHLWSVNMKYNLCKNIHMSECTYVPTQALFTFFFLFGPLVERGGTLRIRLETDPFASRI